MLRSIKAENMDIFHVWNGHGLYSLRQAKKCGTKTVVERASSHPLTFEKIMNEEYKAHGLKSFNLAPLNKQRLLQEFKETDFVTVPSDFSYLSMLENGVPEKKLVKIPFGVDTNYFRPSKKSHEGFNVIYVGQVGFRKGVLYLLEAWNKLGLKDAKLRILGQEDLEIKPFLLPFRNNSSIEFLGYGSSLQLYQDSDVFVLPSLEEGSALVTYEALACGLPAIVTFECGSIVEDTKEGFIVPSKDIKTLAEKIEYLYSNSNERLQLSVNARVKSENYKWGEYGSKLVGFYEDIFK